MVARSCIAPIERIKIIYQVSFLFFSFLEDRRRGGLTDIDIDIDRGGKLLGCVLFLQKLSILTATDYQSHNRFTSNE